MAIINLANTDDWIKDGDYYYYVGELNPNETTSSLIESVTFNPAYQGDVTCTTVGNVKTCESSSDGYSGGTYTLNITTETVQADAYQSVWNLLYDPTEERMTYVSFSLNNNEYSTYQETNNNVFIRKTWLGETIKNREIGFILNDVVYYLKGAGATYNDSDYIPTPYFEDNKTIMLSAFGSENCTESAKDITCSVSNLSVSADDRGYVQAGNPSGGCSIASIAETFCGPAA